MGESYVAIQSGGGGGLPVVGGGGISMTPSAVSVTTQSLAHNYGMASKPYSYT
jgi:hypothetical protein